MCINLLRCRAFSNFEKLTVLDGPIRGEIMDRATPAQLTTLRESLNRRLVELRAEVQAAQHARLQSGDAGTHEVADRKDEAAQRQVEGLDSAQEQRDIDELAQVESALQRLAAGSYGNCADCGDAIAPERLRVQPAAQRCAACQVAYERAQARSR
jgi:RNA polymerase-binding protein DksA